MKATDPDWLAHIHENLEALANMPGVGVIFDAINATIYFLQGNVSGGIRALGDVALDLIPGGGGARSSVRTLAKSKANSATRAVERQVEKQLEKQAKIGKDGGQVEKGKGKQYKGNVGAGNPVNPLTGVKFLTGKEELDFELPAVLPLRWQRAYFSDLQHEGWLGQGWTLPIFDCLKRAHGELKFVDSQGNEASLPALNPGQSRTLRNINFHLYCETRGRYRVTAVDGSLHYVFAGVMAEDARLPLVCMEDRYGNRIRILYDDAGFPVTIHDATERVLQIEYVMVRRPGRRAAQAIASRDTGRAYAGHVRVLGSGRSRACAQCGAAHHLGISLQESHHDRAQSARRAVCAL